MAKGLGSLRGLAACLSLAIWAGAPAHAQIRPGSEAPSDGATPVVAPAAVLAGTPAQIAPGPDSADVHRAAKDLQSRFERFRLRHLPRTMAGSGGGCERVIGRLCIWDGGDPGWTPEPEAPAILEARAVLLSRLDSLAALHSGNAWILGQRVRYRLEGSDFPSAAAVARTCGLADRWICRAFEGLALHRAGDVPGAELAFAAALQGAPEEVATEWTDVSLLLDPGLRDWLDKQPDSTAAAETLWRWSDPFFIAEGMTDGRDT